MLSEFIWPFLFWLYVAATLAQLALWWGIFGRLGRGSARFPILHPPSPVSIILCARNEAGNLRRHLPKILQQEYAGAWEVIVVDDASDDATPAVLQFFQENDPRLRVVRVDEKKHAGKKHALAQGIAAAKSDNLLLTDADCEPASPRWLAHMAAALHAKPETEIALGYGPVRGDWSRFETAHTAIQYLSFALAGMPYMGVGRNLAFRRRAYERAGGFAAHADVPSGDDDLLVNAAATPENTVVCLHPESFMYSEGAKTWRAWMRQKRRHLAAGRRYRPLHQAVLTLVSLSHVLHFFLLAVLLWAGFGMVSVVLLYLARSCTVLYCYSKILPTLRESHLLSRVPIYDALLAAHYGAFVPLFFNRAAKRPLCMEVTGYRPARQEDDYRLVLTARSGCQHAYAALLARYRQAIFQLMLQRVKNPEDARDLTMEAFEKAFRKLHAYTPTHAFSTWLFKIALNNLIDFTRKKQPPVVRLGETGDAPGFSSDWLHNRRSETPTPEEAMMLEQRTALIRRLLGRLDDRYRRMIELRYYEDMSYEEIAQHLDIPMGTVKAQLYRAKENLYDMLQTPQARAHLERTRRNG